MGTVQLVTGLVLLVLAAKPVPVVLPVLFPPLGFEVLALDGRGTDGRKGDIKLEKYYILN